MDTLPSYLPVPYRQLVAPAIRSYRWFVLPTIYFLTHVHIVGTTANLITICSVALFLFTTGFVLWLTQFIAFVLHVYFHDTFVSLVNHEWGMLLLAGGFSAVRYINGLILMSLAGAMIYAIRRR